MQAPGGPEEDPTGGFSYGGWIVNYWDDMMGQVLGESMAKPFELLLGRKTYEIFAAYWPYIKDDPLADKLNSVKKYVVSRTLNEVSWNNSTLVKGNMADAIRNLKGQKGPDIQVLGSGKLIDSKTSTTGVIIATYEPAGEPKTGLVGLDDPSEVEIERRKGLADEGKE